LRISWHYKQAKALFYLGIDRSFSLLTILTG
jgi:hypothetical protein